MGDDQGKFHEALAPGRRPGRPRADVPRAAVTTWLPATDHDRLIRIANRRGVSVSELVRGILTRRTPRA